MIRKTQEKNQKTTLFLYHKTTTKKKHLLKQKTQKKSKNFQPFLKGAFHSEQEKNQLHDLVKKKI